MNRRTSTTPPWLTRRVLGWALYDVASSTYIALVPAFFGLYFVSQVAGAAPGAAGTWGAVAAVSLLIAGVLAPMVGAFADRTARWLGALATATAACVAATLLLSQTARTGVLAAAGTFIVAQVGYTLATSLYDSFVMDVSGPSHRGRVSSVGWALGLVGGVAAIGLALFLMSGVPAEAQVRRLGALFVLAGLMYALLAVPGLAGLRGLRRAPLAGVHAGAALAGSVRAVCSTLRSWRLHRTVFQVLLSFFLINDVLVTLQFFIAIVLNARFGLSVEGLLRLSLLFHLIAVPSTVLCGHLADRWGARPAMAVMCTALASAILLLAFGQAQWAPIAAVVLLGLVFGAIQAVFRALYASLVSADKVAELFGFNSIAGRLSAAVGPLIFGAAATAFGSDTWALCLLLIPLAAGIALLLAVRLPAPESAAALGLAPAMTDRAR